MTLKLNLESTNNCYCKEEDGYIYILLKIIVGMKMIE